VEDEQAIAMDTELLAAIGLMVVNAALQEYSVAELVAVIEGLRDQACQDREVAIVAKTGEAMRLFECLAEEHAALAWLMNDTKGLLPARHFVAHAVAQEPAVAEGYAALFILHPRHSETMITIAQARDNARMIREGHRRIQEEIAVVISGVRPVPRRYRSASSGKTTK
jgi:hypothetical protein